MFHSDALGLLWRVLLCLVLTFLPSFAACACAIHRGARSALWLSLLALAQIGIGGYLAFWSWFAAPWLGHTFSLCLPIGSAFYLFTALCKFDTDQRKLLSTLLWPFALTSLAALMVLSAGFVYGGLETPFATADSRFSHQLPRDNELPFLLARSLRHGRPPIPFFGEWLSSDRPPLQSGIFVSQFAYIGSPKMYQILAVILQSLWVVGLYILLCALRINLQAIRLTVIACLFSGFVLVNSFFVWPKLLAAAFILAFSAAVLSPQLLREMKNSRSKSMLAGSLLALSLLSHGGAAFSVLGLLLAFALLRFRQIYNSTGVVILLSCVCFYLPWVSYQKFYDPPGDRLLKWHLAGVREFTPESLSKTLMKSYSVLPFHQAVENKLTNFETLFSNEKYYWSCVGRLLTYTIAGAPGGYPNTLKVIAGLRGVEFFSFTPSLGVLAFGPICLLAWCIFHIRRQRRPRLQDVAVSATLYMCTLLTLFVWCLLMFVPGSTIVHQGSYAANLSAMAAGIIAYWILLPRLAQIVTALQVLLTCLIYGACLTPASLACATRFDVLALWLASAAALAFTLAKLRPNYQRMIA